MHRCKAGLKHRFPSSVEEFPEDSVKVKNRFTIHETQDAQVTVPDERRWGEKSYWHILFSFFFFKINSSSSTYASAWRHSVHSNTLFHIINVFSLNLSMRSKHALHYVRRNKAFKTDISSKQSSPSLLFFISLSSSYHPLQLVWSFSLNSISWQNKWGNFILAVIHFGAVASCLRLMEN